MGELATLLSAHKLSPKVKSRLHFIHALSLYDLDHVPRFSLLVHFHIALESAYTDITQRRLTGDEIVQNVSPEKYLISFGLEQKRTLENKLEKARRSCVEQLVRFYSRNVRKEAVDSLLTLFFLLQQQREEIPDVFELWSVCLNQLRRVEMEVNDLIKEIENHWYFMNIS